MRVVKSSVKLLSSVWSINGGVDMITTSEHCSSIIQMNQTGQVLACDLIYN